MRKIFLSPFFTVIAFAVLWVAFMGALYYGFPQDVLRFTYEGEFIETITHIGYVLLIGVLLMLGNDYRDKMASWGCFLFLAMSAFLREQGIQHHLSHTDTTPFKSRFFLNPHNPWSEKIIFGLVLLIIAGAVGYLAVKYTKHLIRSFFKLDTVTWSVAVLCTVGVFAKLVDRFPSNWKKAHGGVPLPTETYTVCQLLEESSEMFLPYIAIVILLQYHFRLKNIEA